MMRKLLFQIIFLALALALAPLHGAEAFTGRRKAAAVTTLWLARPALMVRGTKALLAGDLERGIKMIREALKHELPELKRGAALTNLCSAYTLLHEQKQAMDYCNRAIGYNSRNWWAYNNRGNAFQFVKEYEKAAADYKIAAAHDVREAKSNLGRLHMEGLGVPQDIPLALKLFLQAARAGEPSAQYNLGVIYDIGRGVKQDYKQAAQWYLTAAEQGYVEAQANYGIMLALGQGVAQDYFQAHVWLELALLGLTGEESRREVVEFRDAVALQLLPAQLTEARRQAESRQGSAPR